VSILSDDEIIEAIWEERIQIEPDLADWRSPGGLRVPPSARIQPCTIDLHLGPTMGALLPTRIDRYGPEPTGPDVTYRTYAHDEMLVLGPREFVLCATAESITLHDPRLVAILCGKSTLARDGLHVEAAGLADPGWSGALTLEVFNAGPATIILRPGQPICQVYFVRMEKPAQRLYGHADLGSHYQGATQAEAGFDPAVRSARAAPARSASR